MAKLLNKEVANAAKVLKKTDKVIMPFLNKTEKKLDKTDPISLSGPKTGKRTIVTIHGPMSAGKTFLAASASEFYPKTLPAKELTTLSDILWCATDSGATDGFLHNNIQVPHFDIVEFMNNEDAWKGHFPRRPTIIEVMSFFSLLCYQRVKEKLTKIVVVDTLTTLDVHMVEHFETVCAGSTNTYEVFKRNLIAHKKFHTALKFTGATIIYCCHTKAADRNTQDQNKSATVLVAGGATHFPDITGQAAKVYKHDASLQIVMQASKDPKSKRLVRKALLADLSNEVKNRFEGLIPDSIENPNLRDMINLSSNHR